MEWADAKDEFVRAIDDQDIAWRVYTEAESLKDAYRILYDEDYDLVSEVNARVRTHTEEGFWIHKHR